MEIKDGGWRLVEAGGWRMKGGLVAFGGKQTGGQQTVENDSRPSICNTAVRLRVPVQSDRNRDEINIDALEIDEIEIDEIERYGIEITAIEVDEIELEKIEIN